MPIHRPHAGGVVALGDEDLAKIGLAVVYEAAAKSSITSALRALRSFDFDEWTKLDRVQFKQLMAKLREPISGLDDSELSLRFEKLELAIAGGHEARHVIVHVTCGEGGDGFMGYDYARRREVTRADIEDAVDHCAEIRRAANWFAMRVANLVEEGRLEEREEGPGLNIRTDDRWVRL